MKSTVRRLQLHQVEPEFEHFFRQCVHTLIPVSSSVISLSLSHTHTHTHTHLSVADSKSLSQRRIRFHNKFVWLTRAPDVMRHSLVCNLFNHLYTPTALRQARPADSLQKSKSLLL